MIITDPDEKALVKSPYRDEELLSPDQVRHSRNSHPHKLLITYRAAQSPPPYSSPSPQGSSPELTQSLNPPPDLVPINYLHVNEGNNTAKRKIILDLSIPRPPAVCQAKDTPHLMLGSQNGSVSWEVWVLRTNPKGSARERARLHFHTHNGNAKALVVRRTSRFLGTKFPPHPRTLLIAFVAPPPVNDRTSPVPQHQSQGTQWFSHNSNSALLPRATYASYPQWSGAPLVRARSPRRDIVHLPQDLQLLCW
jgi:hypothetical protein